MGKIFTTHEEVAQMVREEFGDTQNYLVALKHNNWKKSLLKLLISNIYAAVDSARQYILVFDEQGIHEKEMSFSDHADFVLIPWHEIQEFDIHPKGKKTIIEVNHLGKIYAYEVEDNEHLLKGNDERLEHLQANDFYRSEDSF